MGSITTALGFICFRIQDNIYGTRNHAIAHSCKNEEYPRRDVTKTPKVDKNYHVPYDRIENLHTTCTVENAQ